MADTDLIACIHPGLDPFMNNAMQAIGLKANDSRRTPSRSISDSQVSTASQRGEYSDYLELKFSHGPKTSHGFVFGWHEESDILLPELAGIGPFHFALTFDGHDRLIVKDLGLGIGTEVSYNDDGKGRQRDFVWIVGAESVPKKKTPIVISVSNHLKFQLIVSKHDLKSYKLKVDQFKERIADLLPSPAQVGIRPYTPSPDRAQIFLKEKLGLGSFGNVTHYWDVSTGEEYALKKPENATKQNGFDPEAWKREADVMRSIRHDHIVRLLRAEQDPSPELYLEYVPGGSVRQQSEEQPISIEECKQILCQLLSALEYLHERELPILHRDVKPDNILVQSRAGGKIHVKFGDFGLSRERRGNENWRTACGTWLYAAPEILELKLIPSSSRQAERGYTAVVDIWSLGLVIFELLCRLPLYETKYDSEGKAWGEVIVTKLRVHLRKTWSEMLQFLAEEMLVIEPEKRGSAKKCYNKAMRLFAEPTPELRSPIPSTIVIGEQATVRKADPQTVLLRNTELAMVRNTAPSVRSGHAEGVSIATAQRHTVRPSNRDELIGPPGSQGQRSGQASNSSTAARSNRTRHSQQNGSLRNEQQDVATSLLVGIECVRPNFESRTHRDKGRFSQK
ncbi:Protein kinase-like domain protein [Metarhizium rileyi]|uniref:Protein kinase-like domain protein n=1 Tax=Metarhizium rileyi (strain RCEF 4871) TaxID=1649241 RepID=A0A167D002_METRR|nr:Protein kinase-like domain protein [Metarhizium rileyi RCEF 4871]